MSQDERDIMSVISARLREMGADEFWRRLFHRKPDSESLDFVGRLQREEIDSYTRALWYADRYNMPWLARLVERRVAMSASLRGKGREEAVKAMTGSVEQQTRSLLRLRKVQ